MVRPRLQYLFYLGLLVSQSLAAQKHIIKDNPMDKLYEASKAGDKQGIWLALDNGADINKQDLGGLTALMHAAAEGQAGAAEELIEQGANVNVQNVDGAMALMIAVERGAREAVEVLLKHKADVNVVDANGATALMRAAFVVFEGGIDTLRTVLAAGGAEHLDKRAQAGDTPLLAAAWNRNWEAMAVLVQAGADVNVADGKREITALMAACAHAHAPTVDILLQHGADVAAVANGKTSLDFLMASRDNAASVAEARGTDFDATDFDAARDNLLAHGAQTSMQQIYSRYQVYGFCGALVVAASGLIVFVLCSTPPSNSSTPGTAENTDTISKTMSHPDTTANKNTDVQMDPVLRRRQVQK